MPNLFFVLTGGPSTGKTTLLTELNKRGYQIVPEAAREVIDDAVAAGQTVEDLRKDELKFQDEVLRRKVATEAALPSNKPIFLDRGMHDTLAYLRYYDFPINNETFLACQAARYTKVFLLDPLSHYEADYARIEDEAFAVGIQQLLFDAYKEYDMAPIMVPPVSVSERLEFILSHLG